MINESKIKIPDSVLLTATRVILSSLFSKLFDIASERGDDELTYFTVQQFRRYNKKFFPLADNNTGGSSFMSIPLDTRDLPKHYQKQKNRIHKIHFYATFDEETTKDAASYVGAIRGVASEIQIKMNRVFDLKDLTDNPTADKLDKAVAKAVGYAIHELTHAVQDKSFGFAHPEPVADIVDAAGDISASEYDAWALDPDEFHPALASDIGDFNALLIDKKPKSVAELKELIKIFVDPTYKQGEKSAWFTSLYRQSKPKWKNAVKYFYQQAIKNAP